MTIDTLKSTTQPQIVDDACGCGHEHHHHDHGHQHAHHHHAAPVATFARTAPKVGRNDVCPCGSGKKHKKCCLGASA